MKVSELISYLQNAQTELGDIDVQISVSDYFTAYGHRAEILESPKSWNSTTTIDAGGRLVINCNLKKDLDGKNAKITFRK
jgi:hypothetical protein